MDVSVKMHDTGCGCADITARTNYLNTLRQRDSTGGNQSIGEVVPVLVPGGNQAIGEVVPATHLLSLKLEH